MEKIYLLMLAGGAILVLVVVVGLMVTFGSKKHKLRKLLQEIEKRVSSESADMLKGRYVQAYNLYLRLSEKNKQNFYGRITKLREKMEEQLKAAKKVEELLGKSTVMNIPLLQQQYEEMYGHFRKLPASVQQKHYPQLMHVKEVWRKGSEKRAGVGLVVMLVKKGCPALLTLFFPYNGLVQAILIIKSGLGLNIFACVVCA